MTFQGIIKPHICRAFALSHNDSLCQPEAPVSQVSLNVACIQPGCQGEIVVLTVKLNYSTDEFSRSLQISWRVTLRASSWMFGRRPMLNVRPGTNLTKSGLSK